MIDWKLFRQYLRTIRLNRGLTQKQLGEQTGDIFVRVSQYENHTNEGSNMNSIYKYCSRLGVSFEDLLFVCKTEENIPEERIVKEFLRNKYQLNFTKTYDKSKINWKKIGKAFQKERLKRKLSVKNLSTLSGLSMVRIREIERAYEPGMHLKTVQKICKALDLDMDKFLSKNKVKGSNHV